MAKNNFVVNLSKVVYQLHEAAIFTAEKKTSGISAYTFTLINSAVDTNNKIGSTAEKSGYTIHVYATGGLSASKRYKGLLSFMQTYLKYFTGDGEYSTGEIDKWFRENQKDSGGLTKSRTGIYGFFDKLFSGLSGSEFESSPVFMLNYTISGKAVNVSQADIDSQLKKQAEKDTTRQKEADKEEKEKEKDASQEKKESVDRPNIHDNIFIESFMLAEDAHIQRKKLQEHKENSKLAKDIVENALNKSAGKEYNFDAAEMFVNNIKNN